MFSGSPSVSIRRQCASGRHLARPSPSHHDAMLSNSFVFARGLTEEQERALWSRGLTDWGLLLAHPDEAAELLGVARAQRLVEAVHDAKRALAARDLPWFRANWPEREQWRLWSGFCVHDRQVALVDIETTGLTPGYDQITVIGLVDSDRARVFVAGRPQPGDEPLESFREAMKAYRLLVTFNGVNFDAPFIERQFRDTSFHFEQPHLDLLLPARSLGLGGGLKDMEKQLGITRAAEIKDMRGIEAIQLWGAWKNGDLAAYQRLTTYCKADCANLRAFADTIYARKKAQVFTPHARAVDFAATKGQQQTLFG